MATEHIKSVMNAANTQTCLIPELRESMRIVAKAAALADAEAKNNFLLGILVSLQLLHIHGSEVAAKDIVLGHTCIEDLAAYAKKYGGDVEKETVKWLKKSVLV